MKQYFPLFIILLLWIFFEIVINPIGEFPLNDDWAYAKVVQSLVADHQFKLCDWQGMTFIIQLVWGYLFCLPFGFSFTALRISTLVMSLFGILFFYKISLSTTNNKKLTFLGTLLLAFNPLYFQLSNTFMTDVPFLVLSLTACWYFINYFKNERSTDFYFAILFSILAVMIRQVGIVMLVAFGICLLVKEFNIKNVLKAILPVLSAIALLFIYRTILISRNNLPANYNFQIDVAITSLLHPTREVFLKFIYYSMTSTVSMGIFILPLIVPFTIVWFKKNPLSKKKIIIGSVFFASYLSLIFLKVFLTHKYLPFTGDIFYHLGLGPVILTNAISYELPQLTIFSKLFWIGLSTAGALSITLLTMTTIDVFRKIINKKLYRQNTTIGLLFLIIVSLLYFLPISIIYVSDRYLLFVFPLTIIFFLSCCSWFELPHRNKYYTLSLSLIVPYIYFSISATHDFLSLNKARWQALDYLTNEENISPKEIDGGFEFNAWHLFKFENYHPDVNKRWWWIEKDNYIVTSEKVQGYNVIKEYEYKQWMPYKNCPLFILQKPN